MTDLENKVRQFQLVSIISLILALTGFSYNAWRLEISESNTNLRVASFQILLELAELERIVFAAHYDKDEAIGNPRHGWIKVRLISDMSMLLNPATETSTHNLLGIWQDNWSEMKASRQSADNIVNSIEDVRDQVREILTGLD